MTDLFAVDVAYLEFLSVVSVTGEIDLTTAPVLDARLKEATKPERPNVVIDLTAVTFLDSTALGALIRARKRCRSVGGDLRIVHAVPNVAAVFEVTGLTGLLGVGGNAESGHAPTASRSAFEAYTTEHDPA